MEDLGLIVADKNMEFTLKGIFSRPESLGIRSITFQINVHYGHDGGVRTNGPETLALLRSKFSHGIVMLDLEGSGADGDAASVERDLNDRLKTTWGDRAKAIVIEPELDAWIWGSDNAIRQALGCSIADIRPRLREAGFEFQPNSKPTRPKEAFELLMRELREPRSSSHYEKITSSISLARCVDPAFIRLRESLQHWFGSTDATPA